jgi:glycosyltransferase involved in cell wall biosynthesis
LVLNIKEAGIENAVIEKVINKGIKKYFLLDVEFPYIFKATRAGFRDIAVRFSEDEPIEFITKYMNSNLYIIVPTLNEEKNINKIYNFILSLKLKKRYQINYKIIFSDDKSSDATRKIIKEIIKNNKNVKLVTPKKRLGLGHALNVGIKNLKKGYAIFIDSDVTITQSSFLNLVKNRKKNTMIVGSRYLKESRGSNFKTRIFLSKLINYLFAKFFNTKIIDLTHSFRIFDLSVKLNSINLKHPGYFLEITINYLKNGNLEEMPIIYADRIYGSSKINLLSIILSLTYSLYVLIFKNNKFFFTNVYEYFYDLSSHENLKVIFPVK